MWRPDDLPKIKSALDDNISCEYKHEFNNAIINLQSSNEVAQEFDKYIKQACQRVCRLKPRDRKLHKKGAPWFDYECREKQSWAIKAGERIVNLADREACLRACNEYRSCKQRKKRNFRRNCCTKIDMAFKKDKSSMWRQ